MRADPQDQIIQIIRALISTCCHDESEESRSAARQAVIDLGKQHAEVVLECCTIFVREGQNEGTLSHPVQLDLVQVCSAAVRWALTMLFGGQLIDRVCHESGPLLSHNAAVNLAQFALSMMNPNDTPGPGMTAASELMLCIGRSHMKPVVDQLLNQKRIAVPVRPADAVLLKCLAELAVSSPTGLQQLDGFQLATSQLLPLLQHAKPEARNVELVFALGGLAEGLLSCACADGETNGILTQLLEVAQILGRVWMSSRDDHVRGAAVSNVARLIPALSAAGFEQLLPVIFNPLVQSLGRRSMLLPAARCVSALLEKMATGAASGFMESNTNCLLLALFPTLCAPGVTTEEQLGSGAARVHSEVLRCFELLVKVRADFVIKFLMGKLEDPRAVGEYLGALVALRHIIAHGEDRLVPHSDRLVALVAALAAQWHGAAVAREIGQLAIAFSAKRWLNEETAGVFVSKMLSQAAQSDQQMSAATSKMRPAEQKAGFNALMQLRQMSDVILDLLTKEEDPVMEQVLWTHLTDALTSNSFAGALGTICKCLAQLSSRPVSAHFKLSNCRPQAMAIRILSLLSLPMGRNQLGVHLLGAMHVLGGCISAQVQDLWSKTTPKLLAHLNGCTTATFKQPFWEEQLIRLFSATSDAYMDDVRVEGEWSALLQAQELITQLKGCAGSVLGARPVLLKYLGLSMRKLESEDIAAQLDTMFELVNHCEPLEQEALAQGVGFSATVHLEHLVQKVEALMAQATNPAKNNQGGGGWSIFSSAKPTKSATEPLQATVWLCIGWIAIYAPAEQLIDYVERQVVNTLTPSLWDLKTEMLRSSALRAVELICKALLAKHPGMPGALKQRDELLDHCLNLLGEVPDDQIKCKLLGMHACTRLVLLDPPLSLAATSRLLDTSILFLSLEGDAVKELLSAVCDMLAAILHQRCTQECLGVMLNTLKALLRAPEEMERERAAMIVNFLLIKFHEYCRKDTAVKGDFEQYGRCLSMLIPRVVDEASAIRTLAVKAIKTTLSIEYEQMGQPAEHTAAIGNALRQLTKASDQIKPDSSQCPAEELQIMASVEKAVKLLCDFSRPNQALALVHGLIDALSCGHEQMTCSRAAACTLSLVLHQKVDTLGSSVEEIISNCLESLGQLDYQPTLCTAISGASFLASRYLQQSIPIMLQEPAPHSFVVVSLLQATARLPPRGVELLALLVDSIITQEEIVDEVIVEPTEAAEAEGADGEDAAGDVDDNALDDAMMMQCFRQRSATAALRECLDVDDIAMAAARSSWLPKVLSAVLICISCVRESQEHGTVAEEDGASTIDDAVEIASILLRRNGSTTALEVIESLNDQLLESPAAEAVGAFSDAITQYAQPRTLLNGYVECFLPHLQEHESEARRLAAAVCLGSVLRHMGEGVSFQIRERHLVKDVLHCNITHTEGTICGCAVVGSKDEQPLAHTIVDALLSCASDSSQDVRLIVFQALDGITEVPAAEVATLTPRIVSTLGNALGDQVDDITCIAALLLSKILSKCESFDYKLPEGVCHTFISCAQEIMERPEASLRSCAAELISVLCQQGYDIESKVYRLLPGLLLQIDDEEPTVAANCANALLKVVDHADCTDLKLAVGAWHQSIAAECCSPLELWGALEELFAQVAVVLASKEAEESLGRRGLEKCTLMLESQAARTRSAAACLGATLLCKLTVAQRESIGREELLTEMVEMMKTDEDSCVRARIARVLGNIDVTLHK